jgi:hypothetical protein
MRTFVPTACKNLFWVNLLMQHPQITVTKENGENGMYNNLLSCFTDTTVSTALVYSATPVSMSHIVSVYSKFFLNVGVLLVCTVHYVGRRDSAVDIATG